MIVKHYPNRHNIKRQMTYSSLSTAVTQLGYPAPWGKKHSCAPRQQTKVKNSQQTEDKNRWKSFGRSKIKLFTAVILFFFDVIKRIWR